MQPQITEVEPLDGYRLRLTFADGTRGETDLADWIVGQGGVMEPLENPEFFRKVTVNHEFGTIVWPNEVDFCPDVLYSRVTGKPIDWANASPEAA